MMAAMFETDGRRIRKSEAAFRTISEVSSDLDVPQHVLRFWETKFPQVRPLKRGGGRRYYRPEDVLLLRRVRDLLYRDGYTIKGVQRLLRDTGRESVRETQRETEAERRVDYRLEPREQARSVPEVPSAPQLQPEPSVVNDDTLRPATEAGLSPNLKAELSALLDELIAVRDILKGASGK